ncbi:MAG TPA: hypothetical protein VFQ73_06010 [Flavisolibacter sp.]|jgi:WD40 repeat protein|nr:hypothetical protein [Flavisolibacter sp.]
MENDPVYTNFRLAFIVFLSMFYFSCAGVRSTSKIPSYNDTIYQQFWTADWSPDNKLIAVGGVDSLLRLYHSNSLELYKAFPVNSWIHAVKWHPDGKVLAIATLDRYVLLLNMESGTITPLPGKGGSRALDWNYNGQLLAVGELEGLIRIWDGQGTLLKTIEKTYDPDVAGRSFLGLDWHPTKNTFIATNFQITLFDTSGRELQIMEHTNKAAIILCAQWHPSGHFFVIGDYGHNWEGENVPSLLHFWTEDGRLLQSVPGSRAEYRNISWNKEGTLLATASDVLRIWTSDGNLLHESKRDSSNFLWGIDWNENGDRIVTASRHKTVALWDSSAGLLRRIDVAKDQ